jgi:hypothetical protein
VPKLPRSGTKGLVKQHGDGCSKRAGDLTQCSCPWWGKYRTAYVSLARAPITLNHAIDQKIL